MVIDPGSPAAFRPPGTLERMHRQAAQLAGLGAWECDLADERLTWTDAVYDLFGLSAGRSLKRTEIVALYADESRTQMEFLRAETIRTGQSFTLDAQIRTARGERRWMRLSAGVVFDEGRPATLFGAKQDVTRERDEWARLRQLADRDPLTGLANRRAFDERYRHLVRDRSTSALGSALVLIDIDRFKHINDSLGHSAGDECLRVFALRLRRALHDADLVARIGGDEFAVVLGPTVGVERLRDRLDGAVELLGRPIVWNSRRIDVSASIGATIVGGARAGAKAGPFSEADEALYAAKASGRKTIRIHGVTDPVTAWDRRSG